MELMRGAECTANRPMPPPSSRQAVVPTLLLLADPGAGGYVRAEEAEHFRCAAKHFNFNLIIGIV